MLANTERPNKFSDVVGDEENSRILMRIASNPNTTPNTIILSGARGCGKAQPKHIKIPTPKGFVEFGSLQAGDEVFGLDARPTKILKIHPQGKLPCYRVLFDDGRSTLCCEDHLWAVTDASDTTRAQTRSDCSFRVMSTREMLDHGYARSAWYNPCNKKFSLYTPLCNVVEFDLESEEFEKSREENGIQCPDDFYSLGLIMASCDFEKKNLAITKKFFGLLNRSSIRAFDGFRDLRFTPTYGVMGFIEYRASWNSYQPIESRDLLQILFGSPNIPEFSSLYTEWNLYNRLEFLRGIFDAVNLWEFRSSLSNYPVLQFGLFSNNVARSVVEMFRSLGVYASCIVGSTVIVDKYAKHLCDGKGLVRNKDAASTKRSLLKITGIAREKSFDCMCIEVEACDGLYLTNDYIVTHNTSSARLFFKALNCDLVSRGKLSSDICGTCDSCKQDALKARFYSEIDSSEMGTKERVSDIIETFSFGTGGGWRVTVFDECHLMTKQAQSALLKVLEDGRGRNKFVLCTTDPDRLLSTIRSRSLELNYSTKPLSLVEDALVRCSSKHSLQVSREVCRMIVQRSHGYMREAYMLLDRYILAGEDVFMKGTRDFYAGVQIFLTGVICRALGGKDLEKEDLDNALSKLLSLPTALFCEEYQRFMLDFLTCDVDKTSDCVPAVVREFYDMFKSARKAYGAKPLKPLSLVRYCTQDWVLDGFTDDVGVQTMLLALYAGAADWGRQA